MRRRVIVRRQGGLLGKSVPEIFGGCWAQSCARPHAILHVASVQGVKGRGSANAEGF